MMTYLRSDGGLFLCSKHQRERLNDFNPVMNFIGAASAFVGVVFVLLFFCVLVVLLSPLVLWFVYRDEVNR
jgi:hypothetical protein